MTKAYVSEELFKVADRCVQVLGGIGVTEETPVAMIFRDMRPFRLCPLSARRAEGGAARAGCLSRRVILLARWSSPGCARATP
jgi:alkylation response protein AidB-like acyl-CoA dehydrogenase